MRRLSLIAGLVSFSLCFSNWAFAYSELHHEIAAVADLSSGEEEKSIALLLGKFLEKLEVSRLEKEGSRLAEYAGFRGGKPFFFFDLIEAVFGEEIRGIRFQSRLTDSPYSAWAVNPNLDVFFKDHSSIRIVIREVKLEASQAGLKCGASEIKCFFDVFAGLMVVLGGPADFAEFETYWIPKFDPTKFPLPCFGRFLGKEEQFKKLQTLKDEIDLLFFSRKLRNISEDKDGLFNDKVKEFLELSDQLKPTILEADQGQRCVHLAN